MPTSPAPATHGTHMLAEMEDRLAASLQAAADEVAHAEGLDGEQRSEVYTILQALAADGRLHREAVDLLAGRLAPEQGDA